MKKKEEYRYQFLKFEVIKTGRMIKSPFGQMLGLASLSGERKVTDMKIPETKEVAVVFDKKTGKVKFQDYEK